MVNIKLIKFNLGFGRFARAGPCALVTLVCNNKVYTANAGDSLGILIEEGSAMMKYTEINQ